MPRRLARSVGAGAGAALAAALLALFTGACDGTTLPAPAYGASPDAPSEDGGGEALDASDAAPPFDDGPTTRVACVDALGTGLTPAHGRLDGTLVSIVGPSERGCPSDPAHLHLQVKMNGSVYDIAVNLDGLEGEVDAKLPGIPYAEGWHPMPLDYVTDLGLHASALTLTSPPVVRSRVIAALAAANHISVFGTGYPGSDGAHLIHRSPGGHDGALVVNPTAPKARVLAFRFASDAF
jgi:hypothetical protein